MKSSTKLMYAFWGVALADLLVSPVYSGVAVHPGYTLVLTLLQLGLMFSWFLRDADDLYLRPSPWLKGGVLLLPFISLPYYLIRYKGFKVALISFSKFLGFVFLLWLMGMAFFWLLATLGGGLVS